MKQIATFHTHLGALKLKKKLDSIRDTEAIMMPVPRKLSASCGTCISFSVPFETAWADEDLDTVYVCEDGNYKILYINQD